MPIWFIDCLLLLPLGAIVYQDFKFRAIGLGWLILLCLLIVIRTANILEGSLTAAYSLANSTFVIIQVIFITVFYSLKNKRFINIGAAYLGWGDVLFFIAISPLFSPVNYVLFYVVSLTLTLCLFVGIQVYTRQPQLIPLAGCVAACLMTLLIGQWFWDFNFYNDVNYFQK